MTVAARPKPDRKPKKGRRSDEIQTHIYLAPDLHEKLSAAARDNCRSLAGEVEYRIRQSLATETATK